MNYKKNKNQFKPAREGTETFLPRGVENSPRLLLFSWNFRWILEFPIGTGLLLEAANTVSWLLSHYYARIRRSRGWLFEKFNELLFATETGTARSGAPKFSKKFSVILRSGCGVNFMWMTRMSVPKTGSNFFDGSTTKRKIKSIQTGIFRRQSFDLKFLSKKKNWVPG